MSEQAHGSDGHLDLVSMGCRWRLDLSRLAPGDAAAMAARWQRAAALVGTGTPLLDEDRVTVTAAPGAAAYDLSRELTRTGLLRLCGRAGLLHAAALADERGRSLVLVAGSGTGKSTATRVLGRDLGYVSDETVVLLADGRIAPHPKPPSLIADPASPRRKEEPPPDALGLGPTPPEPRIAALLTLARDPGVTAPAIEPVGLVDQVLEILPQTSSTWLLPHGLHRLALAATAGGAPARLRYAEIADCRDLVAEHLAAAAPSEPDWEHLPPAAPLREPHPPGEMTTSEIDRTGTTPAGTTSAGTDLTGTTRLVRAPWSDAIAHDGEVLVLAGSVPLRLGGAGAVLWRTADRPRPLAELTDEVVAALGDHPEAAERVRRAATGLLEHGALQRDPGVNVGA